MHSTTARRLLLTSLVGIALVVVGCATPEKQCGMLPVKATTERLPSSGRVIVDWIYQQEMSFARYGEAYLLDGQTVIRMRGEPPRFDDVCGLAKLGHEVVHSYRSHQ
jgi:hypothetical protein